MKLWEAVLTVVARMFQDRQRRTGTVSGTSGTKVFVTIDESSLLLARHAHYTPVVGDTVTVDCFGDMWIITGKIA